MNTTITINNQDTSSPAYNMFLKFDMRMLNATQVYCSENGSSSNDTYEIRNSIVYMNISSLLSNQSVACSVLGVIKELVNPGGKITSNTSLLYYNAPISSDLYPFVLDTTSYVDVMPITGKVVASTNASRLLAGGLFNISIVLNIPNSVSSLKVTIKLPVFTPNARKRRSTATR